MDKNTINLGDFTMEKIMQDSGFTARIKGKSPANKINIEKNNKLLMVGKYILCDDKEQNYDLSDLNENTIIFIDKHHMLECATIIYGAIELIYDNNNIKSTKINMRDLLSVIYSFMDNGITYLDNINKLSHRIVNHIFKDTKYDIAKKLNNLIKNIWFLPYNEIDNIKNNIEQEYFNSIKGDNNAK